MNKFLIIYLILSTFVMGLSTKKRLEIDNFLKTIETREKGMGTLSIYIEGKEVYNKSIGYQDISENIKNDKNTVYRVGSVTKLFTAILIMNLIEENKLKLEDKLSKYLPEIEGAENIEIIDMLQHRSGLWDFTASPDYLKWHKEAISRPEIIKKINSIKPLFKPKEMIDYSNSNYYLLTLLIEKISGKFYGEYLEEKIIKKLKLERTHYSEIAYLYDTKSYERSENWVEIPDTHPSITLGAGSITSSPTEINFLINKLFNLELVTNESLSLMTNTIKNIGLGLYKFPLYDKYAYGHTGRIDGFQTSMTHFPVENISISYSSNGVSIPINDIVLKIACIIFEINNDFIVAAENKKIENLNLQNFIGNYRNTENKLEVEIINHEGNLRLIDGGPSYMYLEPITENKFGYVQANLFIEFTDDMKGLTMTQGNNSIYLEKMEKVHRLKDE